MTKIKKNPIGAPHKEPIEKRTCQGQGKRSKARPGKKLLRGQGR